MSQSDQVSKGIWKFVGQFALAALLVSIFSCCGCSILMGSCMNSVEQGVIDAAKEADRQAEEQDRARAAPVQQ